MSDSQNCCATTGELRRVVEEVAEKAAQSAVDKVHLQLQLELAAMERRISNDVSEVIDNRVQKALGMSPQEHIIQHDRLRRTNDFLGGLQLAFWKKALLVILFAGLAFFGGYATDFKLHKKNSADQAITRDEYRYPKKERDNASNP